MNDLHAGGTLQMLAITGKPRYDTRTGQTPGTTFDVTLGDDRRPRPEGRGRGARAMVFHAGREEGRGRFHRPRGLHLREREITFVASDGGDAKIGQVWRYEPGRERLTLLYEATDKHVLGGA